MEFTHFDPGGKAWMVDVGGKEDTRREAVAEGRIRMSGECFERVAQGSIEKGDVLAAYRDGEIAGFIGFHGDGSGGMLEVLPKFRRLGIGSALEIALHNLALSRGWTPYGQIYTTNNASRKLQERLGMVVSDNELFWMYEERD